MNYEIFDFQELENFALNNSIDYQKFYEIYDLEGEEFEYQSETQNKKTENENSNIFIHCN